MRSFRLSALAVLSASLLVGLMIGCGGETEVIVEKEVIKEVEVEKIVREVDAMAVSGLASTGKSVPFGNRIREIVGLYSMLVSRNLVNPNIHYF